MSRTIVQIVKGSELRAGDVIRNVQEETTETVVSVLRGMAQVLYWDGDDTIMPHILRDGMRDYVTVTMEGRSADLFSVSEPVTIDPRPATIAVYRTRWIPEDDGHGGTTEPDYQRDTREEIEEIGDGPDLIDDTVLRLQQYGLFGDAEHSDRYIDPDGSRIVDYGTGEREEVTAVLRDFDDYDVDRIRGIVGDAY